MWVYSKQQLENRLSLNQPLGFWLDYWLFLLADDTHSVWSTRPFGLTAVAHAVLDSQDSVYDRGLRNQMKFEILAAIRKLPYLPVIPIPPVELLDTENDLWPSSWLMWCENILKMGPLPIVDNYIEAISNVLTANDFPTITFLSRSLAAELGSDNWSKGQVFNSIKETICDSGMFVGKDFNSGSFSEQLRSILLTQSSTDFEVIFTTTPVRVAREIVDSFRMNPWNRTKLIVEINDQGERVLVGFVVQAQATHPDLAAMRALERAKIIMQLLRVRYYLPTHIYGTAQVTNATSPDIAIVNLPQPFWPKATGRRKIPHLPKKPISIISTLQPEEQDQWYATIWHLSEAFSDWPENVHTAASRIWQALESFAPRSSGSALKRVGLLVDDYLTIAPAQIVQFLSSRIGVQYHELNRVFQSMGRSCDWYFWDTKRVTLEDWLWRVLSPSSHNYYARWQEPIAPLAIFHPEVGLLPVMIRQLTNTTRGGWVEKRIKDDLALLYGLRNRVIHRGSRVLPTRMADYLGRLGAEILLTLINAKQNQSSEE